MSWSLDQDHAVVGGLSINRLVSTYQFHCSLWNTCSVTH